jgi:hypothetical protein
MLDYYLLHDGTAGKGVLVEEFALGDDGSATGLDSVTWTVDQSSADSAITDSGSAGTSPADTGWRNATEFSRDLRLIPALRAAVTPVTRERAAQVYRTLNSQELPSDNILRGYFTGRLPFSTAPLLRLSADHTTCLHRILCAGEPARPLPVPKEDVVFRNIGNGVAWCADLTTQVGTDGTHLRKTLHELKALLRSHGLIPVTIEKLS